MLTMLNNLEVRVLGSLVEKQVTTPEYYPLTLNALVQACNQKNNRDPVVSFDETMVTHAIDSLREKNLVYLFYRSGNRVPKYKHMIKEIFELNEQELALLTVLMLRGSQTVGELRERGARLYEFSGLDEVEQTLNSLMSKEPQALLARLPRQPGHKEARYAHLLAGDIIIDQTSDAGSSEGKEIRRLTETERLLKLEHEVETLSNEIKNLRQELEDFKRQFG
ncbi:MAG: YceH family protein [Pyrinomonadaceae bacterium]|nr:YceH family protein [Pyrinomonadaceae bacterium]